MKSLRWLIVFLCCLALVSQGSYAEEHDESEDTEEEDAAEGKDILRTGTFSGLRFRSLGPAFMAGRVGDLAVDPSNPARFFVAACSGGVWKTTNAGTTWKPVFDKQSSYSIGCVTLDPHNPNVVWVGTGENNSQRSVSWGDGVYRSRDGGSSWEHLGLKTSEHIGMITIDPRNSDVVYVAAQGPLWRSGGERGLYKTTDAGKTWTRVLHVSDDTGINEVHLDPRDPDVLYASSYQRRRHVWTLINGGPESTIYKSEDAGKSWRKIEKGLPKVDKGRIGLDVAPSNPDVVYAIVEAADGKSGFFRSTNRGESWKRRSGHKTTSPQYYNEIVCDPLDEDKVYALDTILHVTRDGGKSFKRVPRKNRHVDDHALWINPKNTDHMIVGCDGGVYETWDAGEAWLFKDNLPITQFYRVAVDDSKPFYFVYGGTQDNNTQGGPSRTTSRAGIANEDWFITVGGDGYETQVDPTDTNIVYSQWQYGGLVRFDRRSGERVDIRPRVAPGEAPLRWNWDTPLLMSPHSHTRLYFAANRLFRSDDRGDSWTAISGDLTRQIDRNQLKVMGRIQSVDAVAKDDSTSVYGNSVSLSESPLVEDLLYVGTDDGLVQMTSDAGKSWTKIDAFPGVPEMTYVSCLTASRHDKDTVYAAFDNHKQGDFKPYLLKSLDRGKTWTSIATNLPERDVVYSILEDHENPLLLFAGTEFGVYFTVDGGEHWVQLKSGVPTIAVRDMDIQRRENDLVLGTFGRGFYVLDDYTPLRSVTRELLGKPAHVFPIKDALRYIEVSRLGGGNGKGSQGAGFYSAKNPSFGAVITYHLHQKLESRKEARQRAEKRARKDGTAVPYPTYDQLKAEDRERKPEVMLVIRDDAGSVVARVPGKRGKGIHRVAWNLRYPSVEPTQLKEDADRPSWRLGPVGALALPGTYTAQLVALRDGAVESLADPVSFNVVPLDLATFAAKDRAVVLAFQKRAGSLQRASVGATRVLQDVVERLKFLRKSLLDAPDGDVAELGTIEAFRRRAADLQVVLNGDRTLRSRNTPAPRTLRNRIGDVVGNTLRVTSAPTQTQVEEVARAEAAFGGVLTSLRSLVESIQALEARVEGVGAPWTPQRMPLWTRPK